MYISLCSLYTNHWVTKKDTGYPITVTSISQTIIDCLNNIGLAGGIEELLFALIEVDPDSVIEEDMLECLKLYQKEKPVSTYRIHPVPASGTTKPIGYVLRCM